MQNYHDLISLWACSKQRLQSNSCSTFMHTFCLFISSSVLNLTGCNTSRSDLCLGLWWMQLINLRSVEVLLKWLFFYPFVQMKELTSFAYILQTSKRIGRFGRKASVKDRGIPQWCCGALCGVQQQMGCRRGRDESCSPVSLLFHVPILSEEPRGFC